MSTQVVLPQGMMGASFNDTAIESLIRLIGTTFSPDPDAEWASKYGTDVDNDDVMMHPYCWCEREDCLWCGVCQVDFPDPVHAHDCYKSRLDLLKEKYGERKSWGWSVPWNHTGYKADQERLCREMGLSFPARCEVHCTCGAQDEWIKIKDACTCDYCTASGRWAEKGGEPGSGAPNLWLKTTGLKVWWYKYIGRGMNFNREPTPADAKAMRELLEEIARGPYEDSDCRSLCEAHAARAQALLAKARGEDGEVEQ